MKGQIKEYRYIYDKNQLQFYISSGLIPVELNTHKITGAIYGKFRDSKELQEIFKEWCDRKKV